MSSGSHTVGKTDVNYWWVDDGSLAIWVTDCDDLSSEDVFRVIKCAIGYWLDEELIRQARDDD